MNLRHTVDDSLAQKERPERRMITFEYTNQFCDTIAGIPRVSFLATGSSDFFVQFPRRHRRVPTETSKVFPKSADCTDAG